MAGIITSNMPVYVVCDSRYGNKTYSNLNEGIGKVLRYGAYDNEVITRLEWMKDTVGPTLGATIGETRKEKEGIPLKPIMAQALGMGDECHNRHKATTALIFKEITPYLMRTGLHKQTTIECFRFLAQNNFFLLSLGMASAKAMTLAAHKIKYSTLVTVMTRNGTDMGIWVSGLDNTWFTAPATLSSEDDQCVLEFYLCVC